MIAMFSTEHAERPTLNAGQADAAVRFERSPRKVAPIPPSLLQFDFDVQRSTLNVPCSASHLICFDFQRSPAFSQPQTPDPKP